MDRHSHPTLGDYYVHDLPADRIYSSRARRTGTVKAIFPAPAVSTHYLNASHAHHVYGMINRAIGYLYAGLLDAHPDHEIVMMSSHVVSTGALGLPDDVTATLFGDDQIELRLGESLYTVRRYDDEAQLVERLAAGVKALRHAEARRLAAVAVIAAEGLRPIQVDAVARWILESIRWERAAHLIRDDLATWTTTDHPAHNQKYSHARIQLNRVDVDGIPDALRLELGRDRVLRGTVTIGRASITAASVTVGGSVEPAAGTGDPATTIADHPCLGGVVVKRATPNARHGYVQYALVEPAREAFRPDMVVGTPRSDEEALALAQANDPGGRDAISAWMLSGMDVQERARTLHMMAAGERDMAVLPDADEPPLRLHRHENRIVARGTLSKNAEWSNDAIALRGLPETVMMQLCGRARGRPVSLIVEHPAFEGLMVRAAHRIERPEYDHDLKRTVAVPMVALHLEAVNETTAMAA